MQGNIPKNIAMIVCKRFLENNWVAHDRLQRVVTAIRHAIHSTTDYSEALTGKDVVIHAAARAHIMNEYVEDPLAEYRKVIHAYCAQI